MKANIVVNGNLVELDGSPEELAVLIFGQGSPEPTPTPSRRKPSRKRGPNIDYAAALSMPLEQFLSTRMEQDEKITIQEIAKILDEKGIPNTNAQLKAKLRNTLKAMAKG